MWLGVQDPSVTLLCLSSLGCLLCAGDVSGVCTSSWMQGPSLCALPGAGDWLPAASPRPLPSPSSWLRRSPAPQKSRQVTCATAAGTRRPTFTNEERGLRRARLWPRWAGHPWNSVGPHPGLDAQGWWEDRDSKHKSTYTMREPSGRRDAKEALGQRWRRGREARAQREPQSRTEPRFQGRRSLQGRGLAR